MAYALEAMKCESDADSLEKRREKEKIKKQRYRAKKKANTQATKAPMTPNRKTNNAFHKTVGINLSNVCAMEQISKTPLQQAIQAFFLRDDITK